MQLSALEIQCQVEVLAVTTREIKLSFWVKWLDQKTFETWINEAKSL